MANELRLFFAAMPEPAPLALLVERIAAAGVFEKLGRSVFVPENWHQTLSDRFWEPDAARREGLMRAGELIQASPFTLRFRQVQWSRNELKQKNHCTLVTDSSQAGRAELVRCVSAVRHALHQVGLPSPEGHSPHITLSYNAPDLQPAVDILPFDWTVREILLVEGGGNPYGYTVLGRWPLTLAAVPQGQEDLFA